MQLNDFIEKNNLLQSFPPIDFFPVLTNGINKICWVDLDCSRKNSYFINVDKNDEIIEELTFKDLYIKIDKLLNNGWNKSENCFIEIDIKTWLKNFTDKYGLSLL